MSHIDNLIAEYCPKGVEYRELGTLGIRNKGISITASRMKTLSANPGPVRVFAGGETIADVQESEVPSKNVIRIPSIIVKSRGHIGFTYFDQPFTHKSELWSYSIDHPDTDQKFVYYYLLTQVPLLQTLARATSVKLPQLGVRDTDTLRIPMPPIRVQREIVSILDTFTELEAELEAELTARRQQYEHYRRDLLEFGSDAEWVTLRDIAEYTNGKAHEKLADPEGDIPMVTARFISRNGEANRFVRSEDVLTSAQVGDSALVLSDLPNGRALARTFFVERDNSYAINQRVARLRVKDPNVVLPKFLYYYINRNPGLLAHDNGSDQTHLSKGQVTGLRFPIPPVGEQRRIIDVLDRFDALVNDLSVGLPAELDARRKQYEYYRDKLLMFDEAPA